MGNLSTIRNSNILICTVRNRRFSVQWNFEILNSVWEIFAFLTVYTAFKKLLFAFCELSFESDAWKVQIVTQSSTSQFFKNLTQEIFLANNGGVARWEIGIFSENRVWFWSSRICNRSNCNKKCIKTEKAKFPYRFRQDTCTSVFNAKFSTTQATFEQSDCFYPFIWVISVKNYDCFFKNWFEELIVLFGFLEYLDVDHDPKIINSTIKSLDKLKQNSRNYDKNRDTKTRKITHCSCLHECGTDSTVFKDNNL